jgi:dipeptidyl aminopeptidase/acylaminoacyl peptidase
MLPTPRRLVLLLALAPLLASAGNEPFSAERSWQIQRLGAPTVSPDGRTVVAPVTRYTVKDDAAHTDLWRWSGDGKLERRFTTAASSEGAPQISPDGRWLAFTAKRDADSAAQLYVMALDGGEARRLTDLATGVQSPRWFADGKRLAFVSRVFADLPLDQQGERLKEREAAKMKAMVWDATVPMAWDTLLDEREYHLFQVGVDEGAGVQAITLGSGLALPRTAVQGTDQLFDLAPAGDEVAVVADSDPRPQVSNNDVFTLRLDGSKPVNRSADNPANDSQPLYSPDGKHLAWVQQRIRGFYADRGRLMLHARAAASTRELFPDWDRSAAGLIWAPDGKSLYGSIDDAGTVRVYQLPLKGAPRAVTGESSFGELAIDDRGTLYALRQSFTEPPTLVRIDPRKGKVDKLSTLNDALLAATALGRFESVEVEGADGRRIQMWVNYPPGFDPTKKYPFFLLIHGGPHNAITNSMQFRWNAQVFGSWGYVTAWPNFHGSSGFGQDFADSINPNWADKPYADVIAATRWFQQQPWIDGDRMAAGGGSYGGYLTSILLGREHPFRALVAHAAVYNHYTQYGADFASEVSRFGGFWEGDNGKTIAHTSPHYHAAKFATPTLVIHGQRDLRVPVNHGFELYHTLLQKGVATRMVYFPDENHWVLKPQNSVFWYQQVQRWLEQHNAPR